MQRLATVLTILNFAILALNLHFTHPVNAATESLPVLRGRGLEIVDENGRMRAQIVILPAGADESGQKHADTSLFRLIDTDGRPAVKIGASTESSGLMLADKEREKWSGIQLLTGPDGTTVRLVDRSGKEHILKP
jgi:hypothetical protein